MELKRNPIALARLSEKGQLTIPAEYRRAHALERDSTLVMVEIGDALVLVPHDEALAAVTSRLEKAFIKSKSSLEDLISATLEARAEIVNDEFRNTNEDAG